MKRPLPKNAHLVCPNCGGYVADRTTNGCVLHVLVDVIRARGTVSERRLRKMHASIDPDALWVDVGPILDRIEAGDYK